MEVPINVTSAYAVRCASVYLCACVQAMNSMTEFNGQHKQKT